MRLGLLLVTLSLLAPAVASAQGGAPRNADDERARVLYENGAILYEEGRYEDAIEAWKEAYSLSDRPLFLFNIANALERIGRWDEALVYLNKYRAFAPADERTVLERRMRNIERRLEAAGDRERESEEEKARQEEAAKARAEEERRAEEAAAAAKAAEEESAASGPPEGPLLPGIVLMGAGVGLIAAGGGLAGSAVSAREAAAGLCKEAGDLLLCPRAAAEALDRDAELSLASDVVIAVGAATAATGLVLVIVHLTGGPEATAGGLRLTPTAGPTGLGFGLHGSFR